MVSSSKPSWRGFDPDWSWSVCPEHEPGKVASQPLVVLPSQSCQPESQAQAHVDSTQRMAMCSSGCASAWQGVLQPPHEVKFKAMSRSQPLE